MVPYDHCSGTVISFRNNSFKVVIVEWVVFNHHGETLNIWIQ